MPPIGREAKVDVHTPTEEELQQRQRLAFQQREIVDTMRSLRIHQPPRTRFWQSSECPRSRVVTYQLQGEPDYIKMTAWVERPYETTWQLYTQIFSDLNDNKQPLSEPRQEAFVDNTRLGNWEGGTDTTYYQNATGRLEEIMDTLRVIVSVEQAHQQTQLGATATQNV